LIYHKKLILWLQKFPLLFILSILSFEIAAIILIFQTRIISFMMNEVIFNQKLLVDLKLTFIIICVLILIRGIFYFLGEISSKVLSKKIMKLIREKITGNIIDNYSNDHTHSGEMLSIFFDRVEALDDYFCLFLPQVALSILIPISILFFVFPLDLISGVIFLVTAPLIPFFMILVGKFSEKNNQKQWRSLSKLSSFFLDSIRGMRTLIMYNQKENHLHRILKANSEFLNQSMTVLRISFLSAFVLELMSTLSIAVIAVEIGLRLLYFQLTFEQAIFILLIAPEFYLPLRNLGTRFHAAMNGVEGFKAIQKLIDNRVIGKSQGLLIDEPDIDRIQFENITIQYRSDLDPVISNFSFCFDKGYQYAIVGANGTGKSSIFRALLRLINPTSGRILINENDIDMYPKKQFYSKLSWIPQNPLIFNGTIYENITISNPYFPKKKIDQILERAGLFDFVQSFPQKIDTNIQEFGSTISSGQKQRIALARLLVRDAPIILCDEPTSSLDEKTQSITNKLLQEYSQNKISITIAHRYQTIKQADFIIFLQKNSNFCYGTFDELMQKNKSFREFTLYSFGDNFV